MVFEEHTNENKNYIPNDAHFVARIDGRKLLNTSASSILLNEDKEIINHLENAFRDEIEGENSFKGLGIAINSDVIVFSHTKNDHDLVGVLFNLLQPKVFEKNAPLLFGDSPIIAVNENVGLVYLEMNEEEGKGLDPKSLKKKAIKILSKKSNFDFSVFKTSDDNTMAQSWSRDGLIKEVNMAHNASLSFMVTDTELLVEGELAYNLKPKSRISKDIQPSGIHLSMDQISGIVNDSIVSLFNNLNIPEGKISGLSVNYHELELIADPVLFPAPKFDAIVTFEDDFNIEPAIDSLLRKESSKRIDESSISYSGLKLYFDQVDKRTVYIGTSKSVSYKNHDNETSFRMVGDPSCLTKVEGSEMMKGLIEMLPYFSSGRELLAKVNVIDVSVEKPKNGISKVNASIKFEKGKYPLNSILMFLIESN